MSRDGIGIAGVGAVSPAGWSVAELQAVLRSDSVLEPAELERPGWDRGLAMHRVPALKAPAAWSRHPRLRRASPISRFAAGAALEALGADLDAVQNGSLRLGIVFCAMAGCVNYSRRFFQEVLENPATASPLIFPETVFNAPASHLAALIGSNEINYTLVGDDTAFVHGLVTAANWLSTGRVDGCLVVGSEEADWLSTDAMKLFDRDEQLAEGAGALYLKSTSEPVQLKAVTSPQPYVGARSRTACLQEVRRELEAISRGTRWFDSTGHARARLNNESAVWNNWPHERVSVRLRTGNAFNAATAWQIIAAHQSLLASSPSDEALITVTGCNQEAIGLVLARKIQ